MSEEIIRQPAEGEVLSIVETWIQALTSPTEETYTKIAKDPGASFGKAILWIFLAGLVGSLISGVLTSVFDTSFVPFGEELFPGTTFYERDFGATILGSPVAGIFLVIESLIGTGIIYVVSKMLGGIGTYERLFYTSAAYLAPLGLVTSVLGRIPIIRYLSLVLIIYLLVLNVIANKAVMEYDWGKAVISSVVIPIVIMGVVIGCIIISLGALFYRLLSVLG
jgi:hypothetical protein